MPDYPINQQAKAELYLIWHDSNDKKFCTIPIPIPIPIPYILLEQKN